MTRPWEAIVLSTTDLHIGRRQQIPSDVKVLEDPLHL